MATKPLHEPTKVSGHDENLVGATSRSHRVAGATGVLLIVALLSMFGVGAAAPAKAATEEKAPGLTLTGVESGGAVQLTATLTGKDGAPQDKANVKFQTLTKQFGTKGRLVPMGSEVTDQTGVARMEYKPTERGAKEFFATYAKAGEKPVEAAMAITVTVATSAYTPAPPKPLADVGHVLANVLFAIVAAIWLTLAAQVVRVRRVTRAGQEPTTSSA